VARAIEPALAAGTWVISDRFADSTFVYQGIARGLGIETVRRLQQAAIDDFAPDLTIILDLDPGAGLARAGKRGGSENRFEQFDAGFHTKLREGFLEIGRSEPRRCAVIPASGASEDIARQIWRLVEERLQP
jgi:dTMP kinase